VRTFLSATVTGVQFSGQNVEGKVSRIGYAARPYLLHMLTTFTL